jgi:hypothetical protein
MVCHQLPSADVQNGDEIVINGKSFPVVRSIWDSLTGERIVIVAKTQVRVEISKGYSAEIKAIYEKAQGVEDEIELMMLNDDGAKLENKIHGEVGDALKSFGFKEK